MTGLGKERADTKLLVLSQKRASDPENSVLTDRKEEEGLGEREKPRKKEWVERLNRKIVYMNI